MDASRPVLAHVIGCPAGIGPELSARILSDSDINAAARIIAIGDARVLAAGARAAGVTVSLPTIGDGDPIPASNGPVLIDMAHLDPATIRPGELQKPAGDAAMANFRKGLALAKAGLVDGVTFSPFNKASMRLSYPAYEDEVVFMNEFLDFKGTASEFNILPDLWNARVTSHVPISGVAALITAENVTRALRLTDQAMRAAGWSRPRIAVAGLNPHAGDGGNFGREDIDVLEPVVAAGQREGIACAGPFPSDTVFVRARKGEFDAVLTMYHDQGQIAMKLIGFDQGVTVLGGYPFPIATAAHGSAYDIAGKGIANPDAMRNAMGIATRMAAARRRAA
ncbi:4-hydroxythreonine-4-phosphate dehydrogenase PdxA [Rhabdaerophilum sp. SD176]|uniref:4-hydroxythreonine-4-phosphate dehydrogenase PdxA n=1 Tax=Rhabdaerophilum sp. SD176 TaxID=2983548 RepID=UPI0024DF3772|nr:4-hydroxythreonine-4-phosphate dehydrogenase PdxA [Rhabdaerophilum sp. SD176]